MNYDMSRPYHYMPFKLSYLYVVSLLMVLVLAQDRLGYVAARDPQSFSARTIRNGTEWENTTLRRDILEHEYLANGLLKTNMAGKHPIIELINQAHNKWNTMLHRQSKTLQQARAEYRRRYHRSPPPGFDDWYAFAVDRNFILIDEFDQINRDIAPFLALPHAALRARLEEAKEASEKSGFIIDMRPKEQILSLGGPAFAQTRIQLIHSLILGVSRYLPEMTIYGSGEDRSGRILGGELRQWIAQDKGTIPLSKLQRFENPFRDDRRDIFSACIDPPPPVFLNDHSKIFQDQGKSPTFIHDASLTYDICLHPSLVHLHGSLTATHDARGPRLFPEFVFGKMPLGSEILLPDTSGFDSFTLKKARPWSEKTHNKLFWRGLSTGASHHQHGGGLLGWRGGSQRMRAAFAFANESLSSLTSFLPKEIPLLIPSSSSDHLKIKSYPRAALNSMYTDVGLVEPLIQCNEADGTCAEIRKEIPWRKEFGIWGVERSRWKYILDLDSNGHSADFETSLGLGSVVLKSTIYPHWNADWLVPYYHYIPVQQDYSDVHNIMAFFVGPPKDGSDDDSFDPSRGHDDLAQKIGDNAAKFVRTMWRWEDMQVYMYRLLLEYSRLLHGGGDGDGDSTDLDDS